MNIKSEVEWIPLDSSEVPREGEYLLYCLDRAGCIGTVRFMDGVFVFSHEISKILHPDSSIYWARFPKTPSQLEAKP